MPLRDPLEIDVYYTTRCPHVRETEREIQAALDHANVPDTRVRVREIATEAEAREKGFTGSPTVFVNGQDVVAEATGEEPTMRVCREYVGPGGALVPYPPANLITRAIEEAEDRPEPG